MERFKKKQIQIIWFVLLLAGMTGLILLQYHTFTEYNQIRAFHESKFLIAETEKIIAENDEDKETLHRFLKRLYLEKARSAAYILDSQPEIKMDAGKLQQLAETIGVDQIHLFDEKGTIFSGTNPGHYGLSLNSGDQLCYFKPILEDKTLEMSQDFTPNTAEGRNMLYAMCWNGDGTYLVQVGAVGERFPRILSRNRIDMFLDLVPDGPESDIILTDKGSDRIIASTNKNLVGESLGDVGIETNQEIGDHHIEFHTGFSDNPIYCSAKEYKDFHIYIAQYKKNVDKNLPVTLFTFTEYLILVSIAMTFVVDYYYDRFIQEKNYAMKDKLTNLDNRRSYEHTLEELEEDSLNEDLVFVSMDVNSLKAINDTQGHQAGDILLKGAASCMQQCFEPVGKVFRFGGDEFTAIIYVKEEEIPPLKEALKELCSAWSQQNNIELTISVGFSRCADYPYAGIRDLESIADQQMYANKAKFYSESSHDRRGVSNESK